PCPPVARRGTSSTPPARSPASRPTGTTSPSTSSSACLSSPRRTGRPDSTRPRSPSPRELSPGTVMLPEQWRERLRVPVIAAPMTDVSGPDLVAAACAAGVIGAFPAHNAADSDELGRWLRRIAVRVAELTPPGRAAAPVGVNLVVHDSNARLAGDLRPVIRGGAEGV